MCGAAYRAATTTGYGWDKVPNRTSVQVGAGTPVTTTYDDANRPLADSGGATGAYTSDADGRLTSRPNQRLEREGAISSRLLRESRTLRDPAMRRRPLRRADNSGHFARIATRAAMAQGVG